MDMGSPCLKIKIQPESNPLKSRILVRRLATGRANAGALSPRVGTIMLIIIMIVIIVIIIIMTY